MLSIRRIHEAVDKQRGLTPFEELGKADRAWRTIEQPIENIVLLYCPP